MYQAKHRMKTIEMWSRLMGNEKLTAIGVGARIGHGKNPHLIVTQPDFIFKSIARTSGTISFGIAALHHEIINDPVENHTVIETSGGQVNKTAHRDRGNLAVK